MNEPTQAKPAADAAGARVDRAVGRPAPERARTCEDGCNGCDDCTDYEDDQDQECTYCRGAGTDRYSDHLMACPYCDGSGEQ